jgi:hypothetical protein
MGRTDGWLRSSSLTAWTMLISTSVEAWPVRTFFNASAVKGKCPLPVTASPKRRKGTIKLETWDKKLAPPKASRPVRKINHGVATNQLKYDKSTVWWCIYTRNIYPDGSLYRVQYLMMHSMTVRTDFRCMTLLLNKQLQLCKIVS